MEMEISRREKAIAKFNKATHRYIWHVSTTHNTWTDLCIYGSWGEHLYSGYSLQEAVKKYNAVAKFLAKGGEF